MKFKKRTVIVCAIIVVCLLTIGAALFLILRNNAAAKRNHDHRFSSVETQVAASCTQEGVVVCKCECGIEETMVIPALGHNVGEWTMKAAATCQEGGVMIATCNTCKEQQTQSTPRTAHAYEDITEEGAADFTYACSYCEDTYVLTADGDTNTVRSRFVTDCDENYTLEVYCPDGEEYLRAHLKIVDAYFRDTQWETPIAYSADRHGDCWSITPVQPYTPGNTYIASRSGNVLFWDAETEQTLSQDWSFQIYREESEEYELSEDVIFLQNEEDEGYYPYELAYSEATQTYWVTLQKNNGLKVGDIICVGPARSMEDVIAQGTGANVFGKIRTIHTEKETGCLLELESPELSALFSTLNIYTSRIDAADVEFVEASELAAQAKQALYQSADFAKLVCATQAASVTYLSDRGFVTPLSNMEDLLECITIEFDPEKTPSISEDGTITGEIALVGEIPIPIHLPGEDGEKVGQISITFSAKISLDSMKIVLHLENQTVNLDGKETVVKAQIGCQQQITTSFNLGADVSFEWSLEDKPYVQNTKTLKYHYKTCKHVTQTKNAALVELTVEDLFSQFAEGELDISNECKTCKPISAIKENGFLIHEANKVIHLPNCSSVKGKKAPTYIYSELPLGILTQKGYTECKNCKPGSRPIGDFSKQLLDTMQFQDLSSSMEDFKKMAGEVAASQNGGELPIGNLHITLSGLDSINLHLGVYFNFKLDANMEYEYEQQITTQFGIYLTDNGFADYADSTEEPVKNQLTMTGIARVDLGLKAGISISITGLERWCFADLSALAGLYAEVRGALQHDFLSAENNFAAAFFEAGIHFDLVGRAKLAFIDTGESSFIPEEYQDVPLLAYGFEKIFFNFHETPDEVVVDSICYNLEDAGLLNVKYYDIMEMESGTGKLNIMGVNGKYDVEFSLKNGTNCSIDSGYLLVNTPYESFTDEITVTVSGYDTWGKYRKGNVKYELDAYTVPVRYDTTLADPEETPVFGDMIEHNGHYYKVYTGTCSTWEEAKQFCLDQGGYLAVISTQEENEAVYQLVQDSQAQGAYFGYSDAAQEGQWIWENEETHTYTNWSSAVTGEANTQENYGQFCPDAADGTWNYGDFGASNVQDNVISFICEWESYTFLPEDNNDQSIDGRMNAILGYYQGWYTATQGITGGAIGIHRTNDLLRDENALRFYAKRATECSADSSGNPSQVFTQDDIRRIIEGHDGEYIAIYMFGPLRQNPDVEDGLYTMTVEIEEETGEISFVGSQWIQHDTYVFVDLEEMVFQRDALFADVHNGWYVGELSMVRYNPTFKSST